MAPLATGFLIGGWTGPKIVRRMPAPGLRIVVALAGLALAVKLALDPYRLGAAVTRGADASFETIAPGLAN